MFASRLLPSRDYRAFPVFYLHGTFFRFCVLYFSPYHLSPFYPAPYHVFARDESSMLHTHNVCLSAAHFSLSYTIETALTGSHYFSVSLLWSLISGGMQGQGARFPGGQSSGWSGVGGRECPPFCIQTARSWMRKCLDFGREGMLREEHWPHPDSAPGMDCGVRSQKSWRPADGCRQNFRFRRQIFILSDLLEDL